MLDKGFTLLASIVTLAIISVLFAKNAGTQGVLKSFFDGFAGSIKAAKG